MHYRAWHMHAIIGPATRCDGVFLGPCDASKSHAILCDASTNMLVIWLPILEYLSYLFSNFQTVFSIMIGVLMIFHVICELKLLDEYLYLPSLQCKSQENIRMLHRE